MAFMKLQVYRKGALYSVDCGHCGWTSYTHEWVTYDHNERRDAMAAGTLPCDCCGARVDADTFAKLPRAHYAGRYSAPGYMDCTEWYFDTNKRRLARDLRDMYGDAE